MLRQANLGSIVSNFPSSTFNTNFVIEARGSPELFLILMFSDNSKFSTVSQIGECFKYASTICGLSPCQMTGRICLQSPAKSTVRPPNRASFSFMVLSTASKMWWCPTVTSSMTSSSACLSSCDSAPFLVMFHILVSSILMGTLQYCAMSFHCQAMCLQYLIRLSPGQCHLGLALLLVEDWWCRSCRCHNMHLYCCVYVAHRVTVVCVCVCVCVSGSIFPNSDEEKKQPEKEQVR